ncbi:ArsR/SmtB family transcription factor [Saliphagus sp. GCM10025308]
MDPEAVANALANDTRRKILQLLLSDPKTATETHEQYLEAYEDEKHRETIYRYLETLVEAGIVEKEYRQNRGLVYSVPHHRLVLDIEAWTVDPIDDDSEPS